MIFVTLGTQDKSFKRLLDAVSEQIKKGNIKDKVIVQSGTTKYESSDMEIFDLIDTDEFNKLIQECDLIITHGGVGTILEGLKYGKKIIAAPRLAKYKEHTNDHQKELIREFADLGYILELRGFSDFSKVLEKVKTFKPKKYVSNNENFIEMLENYIDHNQI